MTALELNSNVETFLHDLTPENCLAIGISSLLFFLVIWFLFSGGRTKLSLWHFAFMIAGGFLISSALQEYGKLWDWISLGLTGDNLGALLFLIGIVSIIAVMAYNMIKTNGRTLVR